LDIRVKNKNRIIIIANGFNHWDEIFIIPYPVVETAGNILNIRVKIK